MSFDSEVKKATEAMLDGAVEVVKKVFNDTCLTIVADTPVITGALQNSWNASLNKPESVERGESLNSGAAPMASVKKVTSQIDRKKIAKGTDLFFTNGQPYAFRVEFAIQDSPDGRRVRYQNPAGMLRVGVLSSGGNYK